MSEKILIVDDEKVVVDMLKSYFEMQTPAKRIKIKEKQPLYHVIVKHIFFS